jgi:hypothetical protein
MATTTELNPGTRVTLSVTGRPGKWEPEELHGRSGTFIEIARTHGYARVRFDGIDAAMLVHPESLTVAP